MAQIEERRGRGREVSVDVNLVPFIDLMSVCIIFLLITAVWNQISMIQLGSSIYGKRSNEESAPPPPRAEIPFRLDIVNEGYRIVIGQQSQTIQKRGTEYNDEDLVKELKKIKEIYPDKADAIVSILDELPYENLIRGMDALLTSGFAEISVATAGMN